MVGKRCTNGGARLIYLQLITKISKVAYAAIMRYRIVAPGGGRQTQLLKSPVLGI